MERFHGNIGSFESTLQQAPEIFQTVSVNLAIYVTLCMIDNLVSVIFVQSPIRVAIIGRELRAKLNMFFHHRVKGALFAIWNYQSFHFASITLKESSNDSFIGCTFGHS